MLRYGNIIIYRTDSNVLEQRLALLKDNRLFEYFVHMFDKHDRQFFPYLHRHIVKIALVILRYEHIDDIAAIGRQQLFC